MLLLIRMEVGIFRLTRQRTWMWCLPLSSPFEINQIVALLLEISRFAQLVKNPCNQRDSRGFGPHTGHSLSFHLKCAKVHNHRPICAITSW